MKGRSYKTAPFSVAVNRNGERELLFTTASFLDRKILPAV